MGWNSAPGFGASSLSDLREAVGVPQFSGTAGENWAFVFNGLIFQGGIISVATGAVAYDFHAPMTLQVLGVFLQPVLKGADPAISTTDLNTFTVDYTGTTHDCYWWAIGV